MRFAALVAGILLLAACGQGEDDGGLVGAEAVPNLAGTTFRSTSLTGHDLVPGSTVTLRFQGERFAAEAGCNTMSGTWSVANGVLVVPANLATTQMACEPLLMDQDTWLASFLTGRPTVSLHDGILDLRGDGVVMTLAEQKPVTLVGTHWTLTSLLSKDAISSLPADAEGLGAGIVLPDEKTLQVKTGCNTGNGTVELTGGTGGGTGTMQVGPIALTRMACAAEGPATVEQKMLAVLDGAVTYTVDGDELTVKKGDDGLGFTAR